MPLTAILVRFDVFCFNVGLNKSVVVNMFIKAFNQENKIPFEMKQGNSSDLTQIRSDALWNMLF